MDFRGICAIIRWIFALGQKKTSFEALIGREKCILFIFHDIYSDIPGTKFN